MCFTYGRIVLYYILILILRAVVLMCGRYHFSAEQSTEILKIIQEVQDKCGAAAAKAIRQGEITPGCKMPVLIGVETGPTPELLVWGFRTPKSLLINTRAETALEKPTFAESARRRHCVVPSTGFYEWDRDRRKYRFSMPGAQELYMAGIYDVRGGIPCYSILTTAANESMRGVHDRMPLVLEREQVEAWLYDLKATESFLRMTPAQLTRELLDAQVRLG